MKRINEIFYSLQGEGRNTGRAAIFIRFSGCNLHCNFCDTEHSTYKDMTDEEILEEIRPYSSSFIVLTGGEPSLFIDACFVGKLKEAGYEVAIETNGTRQLPQNIDWVTVSPKEAYEGEKAKVVLKECDELKVVFDGKHEPQAQAETCKARYKYLQPCDMGSPSENEAIRTACIAYIKSHPEWRLSLQTHKLLAIR